MARDGIIALREQHPEIDFSQYDNDGDGEVDYIFIFYAGYGQNEGAPDWTIWPHAAKLWDFYGIDCSYNGVRFNDYACTNELQGNRGTVRTGIGTFVHEYSHILGLMDIYPTRLSGSAREVSCGSYDVMDSGSYNNHGNTPPCFSAFERYSLGWLSPRKLTGPENIILDPLHTTNTALLIDTEKPEGVFPARKPPARGLGQLHRGPRNARVAHRLPGRRMERQCGQQRIFAPARRYRRGRRRIWRRQPRRRPVPGYLVGTLTDRDIHTGHDYLDRCGPRDAHYGHLRD